MDYDKSKVKTYIIVSTYTIILGVLLFNYKPLFSTIGIFFELLSPFIIAIGISFVLNIPMKLIEKMLLYKLDDNQIRYGKHIKRPIAIILTFAFLIMLLTAFILFVVPQLVASISTLTNNVPNYLKAFEEMINQNVGSVEFLNNIWNDIITAWKDIFSFAGKFFGSAFGHVLDITLSVTNSVVDFFLAIVFSIYMLASKETLILHVKKLMYAFFKKEHCDKAIHIGNLSNKIFSGFISGQCMEAVIIGMLCFIGMSILNMPYALLISVLIGVTSLVPIFGAFIGTIPAAFLILLINPMKALWFIVFIIVLQQIEGDFIYPRVVGNSVGLPAIWVMLALILGGSTFGVMGMILGIPLFGVIYQLLREKTNDNLNKKNIVIK